MHSLLSILVTASLMLHATLGCCLHHGHCADWDCGNHQRGKCTADSLESECCDHRETASHASDTTWDGQVLHDSLPMHNHSGCDEGKCSFARTESSVELLSQHVADFSPSLDCVTCSATCNTPRAAQVGSRFLPADAGSLAPGVHYFSTVLLL